MILSKLLPVVVGLGAGILVSAGVFTVLLSVGLVPRFAGKTHTGEKIFLYEEMVVFGTLVGCLASVFPGAVIFGREWLQKRLEAGAAFEWLVLTAEALTGLLNRWAVWVSAKPGAGLYFDTNYAALVCLLLMALCGLAHVWKVRLRAVSYTHLTLPTT